MRYLTGLATAFVASCMLWLGLVYLQIGNATQPSRWVYDVYRLKESVAGKHAGPKVAIVCGSNSLFGIDSERLEKRWGLPVLNDGVHAGLGMPYILHRSKKIVRRGDIVLLPFEYAFYQADGKPSEVLADFILSRDEAYFHSLPLTERLAVVSRVSVKRLYQGFELSLGGKIEPLTGIYSLRNVNAHGDQIGLDPAQITKRDRVALARIRADTISTPELSAHFKRAMAGYLTWAKANGVCLIAMPPNYLFFEQYKSPMYAQFFRNIKQYFTDHQVAFVGEPLHYMYPKKYYFNTKYHLNAEGIQKRTKQALDDLGATPHTHCGGS